MKPHLFGMVGPIAAIIAMTGTLALGMPNKAPGSFPTQVVAVHSAASLLTPLRDECDVQCSRGLCESDEHVAPRGQPNNLVGAGSHTDCYAGFCKDMHPSCTVSLAHDQLDAIRSDLLNNDARAVATWVRDHPAAVEVNAERGALQVLGCEDRVLLHVALTPEMLTFLADQ